MRAEAATAKGKVVPTYGAGQCPGIYWPSYRDIANFAAVADDSRVATVVAGVLAVGQGVAVVVLAVGQVVAAVVLAVGQGVAVVVVVISLVLAVGQGVAVVVLAVGQVGAAVAVVAAVAGVVLTAVAVVAVVDTTPVVRVAVADITLRVVTRDATTVRSRFVGAVVAIVDIDTLLLIALPSPQR